MHCIDNGSLSLNTVCSAFSPLMKLGGGTGIGSWDSAIITYIPTQNLPNKWAEECLLLK